MTYKLRDDISFWIEIIIKRLQQVFQDFVNTNWQGLKLGDGRFRKNRVEKLKACHDSLGIIQNLVEVKLAPYLALLPLDWPLLYQGDESHCKTLGCDLPKHHKSGDSSWLWIFLSPFVSVALFYSDKWVLPAVRKGYLPHCLKRNKIYY